MHLRRIRLYGDPHKTKNRKNGTGTINCAGYKQLWKPGHPCADKRGLIMEHRLVMSNMIGRPMTKDENVHHKNGIKTDNRPENLELWNKGQPSGQKVIDVFERAQKILQKYENYEENYRKEFSDEVLEEIDEIKLVKRIHEEPLEIKITYDFNRPGKITDNGYKMIRTCEDGAQNSGYIMEHRHIMQLILNRTLLKNENIHHIDGNKLNNRPENLELWCRSQPPGQRVSDLVKWAKSIVELYKIRKFNVTLSENAEPL
jgi:hypothetical protein